MIYVIVFFVAYVIGFFTMGVIAGGGRAELEEEVWYWKREYYKLKGEKDEN